MSSSTFIHVYDSAIAGLGGRGCSCTMGVLTKPIGPGHEYRIAHTAQADRSGESPAAKRDTRDCEFPRGRASTDTSDDRRQHTIRQHAGLSLAGGVEAML